MLATELLEYIECAMPHKCVSSERCAQCAINYAFIAHKPVMLHCEHQICHDCEKKSKERHMRCKLCADSQISSTGLKIHIAEKTINNNLAGFYETLRDKFAEGQKLFTQSKSELEASVEAKKGKIKSEIDAKIDAIRAQLDEIRGQLYADVDNYCEIAMK